MSYEDITWEFKCRVCGHVEEIPSEDTEFTPSSLLLPECPDCDDQLLAHVGPVLDECDRCDQKLLYRGNSGLGDDTLCDRCYERLDAAL